MKKIVPNGNGGDNVASNPPWTDEDENKLEWLKLATIHTWFEEQYKCDTALVIERMTPKDRAAFLL